MARKQSRKKQEDGSISLGDMLNNVIVENLRKKQTELQNEEKKRLEELEKRKREERKQREKNKSFEELLNESNLNWKQFKD